MTLAYFLGKEKAEYRFKESDFVVHHHQSYPGSLTRAILMKSREADLKK